jgi:hypothetical protein
LLIAKAICIFTARNFAPMFAVMPLWLKIYLLGCLLAFTECIIICEDRDKRISWVELIVSIICSAFSWLLALALFIGQSIKHGHDKNNNDNGHDSNNDDKDNDNLNDNNLAGT